jgi:predicted HAD superfamily Cof-like phosphohydrolase
MALTSLKEMNQMNDLALSWYDVVKRWHRKYGLSGSECPICITGDDLNMRLVLIYEEFCELREALVNGDMVNTADGIADLIWVLLGTADIMGLPMEQVFAEVARSNNTKVRASGDDDPRSLRGSKLDVVKGDDYSPPDIGSIIEAAYEPVKGSSPLTSHIRRRVRL